MIMLIMFSEFVVIIWQHIHQWQLCFFWPVQDRSPWMPGIFGSSPEWLQALIASGFFGFLWQSCCGCTTSLKNKQTCLWQSFHVTLWSNDKCKDSNICINIMYNAITYIYMYVYIYLHTWAILKGKACLPTTTIQGTFASFPWSKCHRFLLWIFPKHLQHQPKCFRCWIITWTWFVQEKQCFFWTKIPWFIQE